MQLTRTIYRCTYVFKDYGGPVRDSKAFPTEEEARHYAEEFNAAGYLTVVWREFQVKTEGRWKTDLHHETTGPLDE